MALKIDIIAEDDAVRDSTRVLLESYGYELRDYPSAEAFLCHARDESVCLVVDQHMPAMGGLALLEHLHAQGKRTPAVLMTGLTQAAIEPRLAKLGAKLLRKPAGGDELMAAIEQVVQIRR